MSLNNQVRDYWEQEPCGTSPVIIGESAKYTRDWFDKIEEHRYTVEPFIHAITQFTHYHGKKLLEVGVGAGTDHLQWARAGVECYGVDLTDAAIETTQTHLAVYGFKSVLQRVDAEKLPFENNTFDLVYSWGVIHHSEKPEVLIEEIRRVLKPGGLFIGMMYGRHSLVAYKLWIKYALLQIKPWHSLSNVIWHHMESIGTKAYTIRELRKLFINYSTFAAQPILTSYDTGHLPRWLVQFAPDSLGWFITLKVTK